MALPVLVYFISVCCLLLPVAIGEVSSRSDQLRPFLIGYRFTVTGLGVAIAAGACIAYLVSRRSAIESSDFYYYVCYARDTLHHGVDVPSDRYRYFPGVYAFWRTVMRVGGESLVALQWAYVLVLAVNCVLVAGIVARGCRRIDAAVFAGIWYLVLASRFEGFAGVTEPLATIPFLAGVLAWGGRPLRGRAGVCASAILGTGIGLALYVKQQAGLLSLGAAALLLVPPPGTHGRHGWAGLCLLPLISAGVFALAIAIEGMGLAPLAMGLHQASSYPSQSSWGQHLYALARNDESATLAALLTALAWSGCRATTRSGCGPRHDALDMAGLLVLAGAATLVQYRWRGYYHYALLAVPCLVAAAPIVGGELFARLPSRWRDREWLRWLAMACAGFPLAYTGGNAETLQAWNWQPTRVTSTTAWRLQPEVAADLDELASLVARHDELIVCPPRRNEIHWILGSRLANCPFGYYWEPAPEELRRTVERNDAAPILVMTRRDDPGDVQMWEEFRCQAILNDLPTAGYHPVWQGRTMTLWRRKPPDLSRGSSMCAWPRLSSAATLLFAVDRVGARCFGW